jgi:hypothetical protein
MITDAKQITDIAKKVIEQDYDYEYIGIRVQESDYGLTVGQEVEHVSRHWVDGNMTDDDVDGICAVSALAASQRVLGFGAYSGNVLLVIGSNRAEYGEDPGEIILKSGWGTNPIILDIIRL